LKFKVTLTGISAPNNKNEIKVYPNPTKDYLNIDCGDYATMNNYQLKITNVASTVFVVSKVTKKEYSINLSGYSKGIYFLEIYDSGKPKTWS